MGEGLAIVRSAKPGQNCLPAARVASNSAAHTYACAAHTYAHATHAYAQATQTYAHVTHAYACAAAAYAYVTHTYAHATDAYAHATQTYAHATQAYACAAPAYVPTTHAYEPDGQPVSHVPAPSARPISTCALPVPNPSPIPVNRSTPPKQTHPLAQFPPRSAYVREKPVDARYLTPAHRDQLKRVIYTRRDEIAKVIERMEAKHWYTDDAVLQNLRSAYHALHAAVQVMCSLDGSPVETKPVGPIYPLPSGRQKRRGWVG